MMANNITLFYNVSVLNSKLSKIMDNFQGSESEQLDQGKETPPEVFEKMLRAVQDAIDSYRNSQVWTVARMMKENPTDSSRALLPWGTP